MGILNSAAKIVFILLSVTACLAFGYDVVTGKVIFETKDFMLLASGASVFFFSYKGNNQNNYLGK